MPRAHLLEIHCHGASGSMSEMNSPYEFTAGERYFKKLDDLSYALLKFFQGSSVSIGF
jgi:hypothetical protein